MEPIADAVCAIITLFAGKLRAASSIRGSRANHSFLETIRNDFTALVVATVNDRIFLAKIDLWVNALQTDPYFWKPFLDDGEALTHRQESNSMRTLHKIIKNCWDKKHFFDQQKK